MLHNPWCTLFNKNQTAPYFERPTQAVTWHTVAIIIRVILLSPYLCIHGVSLSSIHYNQSRYVYINAVFYKGTFFFYIFYCPLEGHMEEELWTCFES
jgi:hypothetical protein